MAQRNAITGATPSVVTQIQRGTSGKSHASSAPNTTIAAATQTLRTIVSRNAQRRRTRPINARKGASANAEVRGALIELVLRALSDYRTPRR